jgi:hypothetical protein
VTVPDQRSRLLLAAVGFACLSAADMARLLVRRRPRRHDRGGYDLRLTQYADRGWRATFYTTGMEHSPTEAASECLDGRECGSIGGEGGAFARAAGPSPITARERSHTLLLAARPRVFPIQGELIRGFGRALLLAGLVSISAPDLRDQAGRNPT